MVAIVVLLAYLVPVVLVVAVIVWGVNLSASVRHIETMLARMDLRLAATPVAPAAPIAPTTPTPAAVTADPSASAIDIEPFVD